ncbi:MAG: BsaA family SipW-dependent biofilm matrix protein [Oscillospiraceae bacterium]|nr:BsaA family SipW-dependent biofilm matrix protein [Oscillospiraceae bacterium]
MKKTAKKSAKEKRVLIAALIVAAVTVAGSTFAWFTSKDEVTNRLTASADYGVSIVEDFTPPSDWLPGQKINKDVSAVNTGNIGAFVRLGLLYDSKLTTAGEGVAVDEFATNIDTLVELKTSSSTNNTPPGGNTVSNTANEVTLLQAGGTLVIAGGKPVSPSDAWSVRSGDDSSDSNLDDYSGTKQFHPAETKTASDPDKTYAKSDEYGEGLYIFQRTVYEDNGETIKYSGYYYKDGKFYALVTEPGTVYIANIDPTAVEVDEDGAVTLAAGALDDVRLANTQEVTIQNTGDDPVFTVKWLEGDAEETEAAEGAPSAKYIRLTYAGNIANDTADDVIIDIELADNWSDDWTFIAGDSDKIDSTNDTGYFYYNHILDAGATTPKLVDSVTLNQDVTQEAYKDLQFDLSVILDSIQITPDEAKTNSSYTDGVNGAEWGAKAEYDGEEEVTWTKA